jgi:hypothetical protein
MGQSDAMFADEIGGTKRRIHSAPPCKSPRMLSLGGWVRYESHTGASSQIRRRQIHIINPAGGAELALPLALGDERAQRRKLNILAIVGDQGLHAILALARAEGARKPNHVGWVVLELESAGSGHSLRETLPQVSRSIFRVSYPHGHWPR